MIHDAYDVSDFEVGCRMIFYMYEDALLKHYQSSDQQEEEQHTRLMRIIKIQHS
jgi:hypothetical protein